ncbi:MAG TPA: response regulator SirA [Oceanospirillaceae bacterium]|nr:response regulator SirA [Oceanospirillaceae bacterium]
MWALIYSRFLCVKTDTTAKTNNDTAAAQESWQLLLDAQGLQCPLPLLKAKRAISQLAQSEHLKVLATDSGSQGDFAAWTKLAGHRLLQSQCIDGVYHYLIEKA